MDILTKQKYIFSRLFLLANKIQLIGDRVLSGEMTIKQWLLTAAVAKLGESPPTISEAAELMGSSHQNVKQLAVKLQDKGFLLLEKDEEDFRATRIMLTEKTFYFWQKSQLEVRDFLNEIFSELTEYEIDSIYQCFHKLYEVIDSKHQ